MAIEPEEPKAPLDHEPDAMTVIPLEDPPELLKVPETAYGDGESSKTP